MTDIKDVKKCKLFICEFCNFNTSNKYNYTKHLTTDKHLILTNTDKNLQKNAKSYDCHCGKSYKHRQSLLNHKKKCLDNVSTDIIEQKNDMVEHKIDDKKIIEQLVNALKEQNKVVQEQNKIIQEQHNTMKELIPKIGNNNGNINIGTMNNITLLNDKCKDAISINDFINSIDIDIKDLLYTAKKGLPNGISNILVEHLNNLPLIKRPIWCSDKKRKKLFIKEEAWCEDTNQEKTKEAIKNLSVKQTKNINKFTKENPDWMQNDNKKDIYLSIVKNVTDPILDKSDKIIDSLMDTIHLSHERNKLIIESI